MDKQLPVLPMSHDYSIITKALKSTFAFLR